MRVGDPFDEETEMGPLISADHRESPPTSPKTHPWRSGAGARRLRVLVPTDGLAPVSNDDKAAREEIFGPVVAVIPFEDEEDAVRQANDTVYGLWFDLDRERRPRPARGPPHGDGRDLRQLQHLRRVATPFGGFKQSGVGRELGPHALDYYTEVKNVYLSTEED